MREIKFRAWNKPTMQMTYWPSLQIMLESSNGTFHDKRNFLAEFNDFMQFTGLKDSKGKEIYEGDICKYFQKTPLGWIPHKGEMVFDNRQFKIKAFVDDIWDFESDAKDIEVIGNIYENPELLK